MVKPESNNGEVRLVDDEGKSYTLINHGDGKETALYDDAESLLPFIVMRRAILYGMQA